MKKVALIALLVGGSAFGMSWNQELGRIKEFMRERTKVPCKPLPSQVKEVRNDPLFEDWRMQDEAELAAKKKKNRVRKGSMYNVPRGKRK